MNTPNTQRAWIFVNGILPYPEALQACLQEEDFLIAADGGARHLLRMGKIPHVLIGDLDSLTSDEVAFMEARDCEIHRYSTDKDWTDLELAMNYALEGQFSSIRLAAAGGGRIDQALGNIFLLTRPDLKGIDVALDDGKEEILLIEQQAALHGQPGDRVSLVPLDEQVTGVTTHQLQWPLKNAVLYRHATRGISNIMLTNTATIMAHSGTLLCIHTRKDFMNDEKTD